MALAMVWAQLDRRKQNPVILAMNDTQLAVAPRPMVRHVAGRMARVVFPTEFLQHQSYEKYRLHMRAAVLPFGADDTLFYPDPLEPPAMSGWDPLIVYAGPLTHHSGVHVLLDAARLLRGRGIGIRLLIIERSEPGASAEAAVNRSDHDEYVRRLRSKAADNVWFETYTGIEHVAEAMRSAAIVVSPWLGDEAFGLANVEAMASGAPVVASCVGGIPDVFFEGGALLIPPSDAIALANAIERLLGKTGVAKLLRREGRQSFLRNYRWPAVAAAYVDLIAAVSEELTPRREALP
jgi:glycosyltransferase involved in cell wall biosynthesis